MEARREQHHHRQRVDLRRLSDADLDSLERLALAKQAWPGPLEDWLKSLPLSDHYELVRLHALAR